MNQARPTGPRPVPGATRDIDITPPGWQLPPAGSEGPVIRVIRELFGDAVSFTLGVRSITLRLQVYEEIPVGHVEQRRRLAIGRIYAADLQEFRERELEDGTLETERAKMLVMAERAMKAAGSSATFKHGVPTTPEAERLVGAEREETLAK